MVVCILNRLWIILRPPNLKNIKYFMLNTSSDIQKCGANISILFKIESYNNIWFNFIDWINFLIRNILWHRNKIVIFYIKLGSWNCKDNIWSRHKNC